MPTSIAYTTPAGKFPGFFPSAKEAVNQGTRIEPHLPRILFPADDSAFCHSQVGVVSYVLEKWESDT